MQNLFLLAAVFGVATAQQAQHLGGGHCQFTDLLSAKNDAHDGDDRQSMTRPLSRRDLLDAAMT